MIEPVLRGSETSLLERYDAVLLDLDGTVYLGPVAVPDAAATIAAVHAAGVACCYLTNNASRTASETAHVLRGMGIPAVDADVVTAAQAAARLLAALLPVGSPVLVVGGAGLVVALEDVNLVPVRSAHDSPRAVVQGFAPEVGWQQLAEAAYTLADGVPWVASNRDLTLPTSRGLAPGNGSLVEVLRLTTGAEPTVAGKPERPLVEAALERTGGEAAIVVGDRLDTDIACAVRAELPSLLVLTGVTDLTTLLAAPAAQRPTYVSATLAGLLDPHPPVVHAGRGAWTVGSYTAVATEGVLRLTGAADLRSSPYDAARAACVATWAAADAGEPLDVRDAVATLQPLLR